MGCTTCKEKNGNSGKNEDGSTNKKINLIPEDIANGDYSGNFLFKVVAFCSVTIALPFIILIMVGKIFLTFFMPKSLTKVNKSFSNMWFGGWKKYTKFRQNKEIRKRKNHFEKNKGYEEGSELVDIEDYTDIDVHEDNNEKE
jgi:hypothetical protein